MNSLEKLYTTSIVFEIVDVESSFNDVDDFLATAIIN